jgi:hypothetical protein
MLLSPSALDVRVLEKGIQVNLKRLLNFTEMLATAFGWRAAHVTDMHSKLQRKLGEREEYSPMTCSVLSVPNEL